MLVALQSLLIFQNKSTHPGLDDKVFLVFCKFLSQMISNFYRDFILIYKISVNLRYGYICCKAFRISPTEGILSYGGWSESSSESPVWECDFNGAVRKLH